MSLSFLVFGTEPRCGAGPCPAGALTPLTQPAEEPRLVVNCKPAAQDLGRAWPCPTQAK
jgi:hypothetical protein